MVLQQEIEKVQNRAARFVTCNCCFETVGTTGILKKKTKMGVSQEGRRDSRLILLYKGLKGTASIPTDDLTLHLPQSSHLLFRPLLQELTFTRARSSLKQSDWNALPDLIITSVEGAEDSVARFTSLVRARD